MSENKEPAKKDNSDKYFALIAGIIFVCFTAILIAFVVAGRPDLAFSTLRGMGMGVAAICFLLLLLLMVG